MLGTCVADGAFGATVAAALQFFAASQCLVQEHWPAQDGIQNGSRFDFIVIGGGTAGATLAARLTEMVNFTVLLVEAGGDPPQDGIVPGFKDALKASSYDWNFTTVNDLYSSQALEGGSQRQPRGKMLGGSGSLNDMVYARGFPVDYEEWASIVGEEWNWTTVLEYFKKTEYLTDERIVNEPELMKYHGRKGEIEVAGLNESTYATDRFIEAFHELGFDIVKDLTNPNGIGVGRFSHTIRDGRRDSSATALLNKAADRRNLFVLKNALVTKISIQNNTANGVLVAYENEVYHFYADKEVLVSGGTFNTAKLLQLSGIGPKDHLEELNIDVVKDLPVGDNLHDHVMVLTYLASENGTCYQDPSSYYMDMIAYLHDRTGSFSKTNSMGVYLSLNGSKIVPDFAIYPTCMPKAAGFYEGCVNILGFKREMCLILEEENRHYELINLAVVLLKPKSRGKVRLNSTDPNDEPLIYSGTFSDPEDLAGFSKAINVAWSLTNTSYFKAKNAKVIDLKIPNCKDMFGAELAKCQAKATAISAWHTVGTAAMGTVVDARLKVLGVTGLRVVDASVMPKVIRGNTNAPVVMIAEMAADFIKKEWMNYE